MLLFATLAHLGNRDAGSAGPSRGGRFGGRYGRLTRNLLGYIGGIVARRRSARDGGHSPGRSELSGMVASPGCWPELPTVPPPTAWASGKPDSPCISGATMVAPW